MREIKCGILSIAQHSRDPKYKFFAGSTTPVGGWRILEINADGEHVRWYVEPSTGRIMRITMRALSQNGVPAEATTHYRDWKAVNGLSIPFKASPVPASSKPVRTESFEVNPAIDFKLFDVPSTDSSTVKQ